MIGRVHRCFAVCSSNWRRASALSVNRAVPASFIAGLLRRHRWIAYVGLAIILYVALRMIWEGMFEVHEAVALALPWSTLLLELEILVELAAAVVAETEAAVAFAPSGAKPAVA